MKIFAGTLLAAMIAMGSAHAQVVTFDFTAKVNFIAEYNGNSTTEVTSSTLSGLDIAHGDLVHGQFSFDVSTPLSPIFDWTGNDRSRVYEGTQHPVQGAITFERPAYTFTSNNPHFSSISVSNTPASFTGDGLSFQTASRTDNDLYSRALSIQLRDESGNALSSTAIPGSLSLPAFSTATVGYSWIRLTDGVYINTSATITSMTQVVTSPVPEPSTYAMLAVGLLAVGAVARRKAAARR